MMTEQGIFVYQKKLLNTVVQVGFRASALASEAYHVDGTFNPQRITEVYRQLLKLNGVFGELRAIEKVLASGEMKIHKGGRYNVL